MDGNAQTRATAKWQQKKGLITKAYKLHRNIAEEFAEACEAREISQAAQLEKYMKGFIKRAKNEGLL
jgi:malonyl CoA-acyl carrier protein transacylase